MTNRIHKAFDGIHAEAALKANTLYYLQGELQRRRGTRAHSFGRRFAFASLALLLCSGILSHALYFSPGAYIDVDVNPSIELTLNRFDRVISARAHNGEGDAVLEGLSLTHKNCSEALLLLVEAMNQGGYVQEDGLISVTLQTSDLSKEARLLSDIRTDMEDYMLTHHQRAQLDVFPVGSDTRSYACEQGLSPAKYLAIQALIEVDPTATVESCREHSISELRQMTQAHGAHHAGGSDAGYSDAGDGQAAGNAAGHEGGNGGHDSAAADSGGGDGHKGKGSGGHSRHE